MKRFLLIVLVCTLMLSCSALADDLGVQMIGDGNAAMVTLTLDDVQLEQVYEIGGYARIAPRSFAFVDLFPYYAEGKVGDNHATEEGKGVLYSIEWYSSIYYNSIFGAESGNNAEYAWFLVDLTNMQKVPVKFMEEVAVKVIYDDEYEYQGWVRQFNYDYDTTRVVEGDTGYGTFIRAAINPVDEEPIDIVYTGHYVFGCTLPNAVVEDKAPLRMVIMLGDNELTYHIRK